MTSPSIDEAKSQIHENGFCKMDDPIIGLSMEDMRTEGLSYEFSEEAGFRFCRDHVLQNSRVQDIIRALGSEYVLAHRGILAQDPFHTVTLRNGGKDPDILIVQLWPKGSRANYYSGSHKATILRRRNVSGLWEAPSRQLQMMGYKAAEQSFEEGGLVIFDARIFLERVEKRSYYYTYYKLPLVKELDDGTMGMLPPASQKREDVEELGVYVRRE